MHRLIILLSVITSTAILHAGSAALTADGKTAYVSVYGDEIAVFDMAAKTYRKQSPATIGAPAGFQPRAISKSGYLIGSTDKAVIVLDLAKHTSVTLYTAPDQATIEDVAYNAKDGGSAVTLAWAAATDSAGVFTQGFPLVYVPADPAEAAKVFCRRVDYLSGMSFEEKGNFYFGFRGDLWCGRIQKDEEQFVLVAERHAPVATLETYAGTPSQMGVREVLCAGTHVYASVMRMGGSGWGEVVRMKALDNPVPADSEPSAEPSAVEAYAKRSMNYLSSLEALADAGNLAQICGTRDGKLVAVFFGPGQDDTEVNALLIRDNGKPEKATFRAAK